MVTMFHAAVPNCTQPLQASSLPPPPPTHTRRYRFGVLGQDEPIVVEVAAGKDGAGKGKDSAPPAEGAGAPASGVVGDKGKPAGAGVGM